MCVFVVELQRVLVSCPCVSIPASDFEQLISVGQQKSYNNTQNIHILGSWYMQFTESIFRVKCTAGP